MGRSKSNQAKTVRSRDSTGDQAADAEERSRTHSPRDQTPELAESKSSQHDRRSWPMVSICTVTHNRDHLLPLLEACILNQTYPRDLIEWVIVNDSDLDKRQFRPSVDTALKIKPVHLDQKIALGRKRNLSHRFCEGDVIVYMDDDEFYPPTRVEHAVHALQTSGKEIAGATKLPILFIPECELWMAGPYGTNHATANTFAFRRSLLAKTQYDDAATCAEEKAFLRDYTLPMVQLDPMQTIVCFGHSHNTFDKRKLAANGSSSHMKRVASLDQIDSWIDPLLLDNYLKAHALSPRQAGTRSTCETTSGQASRKGTLFLISSPEGSGERLIFKILGQLGATLIVGRGKVEELFSLQLLMPKGFEPRVSAEQIQQVLQNFNRLLLSRCDQGTAAQLFVLRDPKAALLLQELATQFDLRLIICLRPMTEIVANMKTVSDVLPDDAARQAHRLYGHLFSTVTNTLIPYQLVRYHDLISNPLLVIQQLSGFCGLTPSDEQISAAQQVVTMNI